MPLTKSRFAACGESTLVATSAAAASPAVVSAPVADGKKLFKTWPFCATMNSVKTGGAFAAHAERGCKLSRNGKPTATPPAPNSRFRLLTGRRFAACNFDLTGHLQRVS